MKVNKTIENLNNRNKDIIYKFDNQKISTIALEFMKNEFGGIPYSTMNRYGDYIFYPNYIKNNQFNGWLSQPQSQNLQAYDYNKHYTSLLMGLESVCVWPVYSVFDEVKSFDGVIDAVFYYVETTNFFPFKGAGWYEAELVYYACKKKIIYTGILLNNINQVIH